MSARLKREYVQAIYQRYRHARRSEKRRILDEFCQVAGYHRKHAIRLLNSPAPGAARPPRPRPLWAATYSLGAIEALRAIWEAAGYPWSLRLKAVHDAVLDGSLVPGSIRYCDPCLQRIQAEQRAWKKWSKA